MNGELALQSNLQQYLIFLHAFKRGWNLLGVTEGNMKNAWRLNQFSLDG